MVSQPLCHFGTIDRPEGDTNAFLPAAANVTNITVQNQCSIDDSEHLEIANDPVAMADMLNALDPAQPVKVPCLVVLPVFGPVGPVPSFRQGKFERAGRRSSPPGRRVCLRSRA